MTRSNGAQVKARRECFDAHKWADETGKIWLTCHLCDGHIDPGREAWEASHVLAVTFDGTNDASNVFPAHVKCHRAKTNTEITANAKCKRQRDKHLGFKRKGGWSKYRRKMDGTIVLKENT